VAGTVQSDCTTNASETKRNKYEIGRHIGEAPGLVCDAFVFAVRRDKFGSRHYKHVRAPQGDWPTETGNTPEIQLDMLHFPWYHEAYWKGRGYQGHAHPSVN
ncbi:unnamed protein product, partial [marine sediment metagenome]